jgi:hypothetical protein
MSLKPEKINALKMAKEFLYELCEPNKRFTKKELRGRIRSILKHWPHLELDIMIRNDDGTWPKGKK